MTAIIMESSMFFPGEIFIAILPEGLDETFEVEKPTGEEVWNAVCCFRD